MECRWHLGSLYASGTIDKTIVVAIHSNGNKRHTDISLKSE